MGDHEEEMKEQGELEENETKKTNDGEKEKDATEDASSQKTDSGSSELLQKSTESTEGLLAEKSPKKCAPTEVAACTGVVKTPDLLKHLPSEGEVSTNNSLDVLRSYADDDSDDDDDVGVDKGNTSAKEDGELSSDGEDDGGEDDGIDKKDADGTHKSTNLSHSSAAVALKKSDAVENEKEDGELDDTEEEEEEEEGRCGKNNEAMSSISLNDVNGPSEAVKANREVNGKDGDEENDQG